MNGLGTPRSESPVVMAVDSPYRDPPSSPKVISCKNCKFSFRSSIEFPEFCSRDCDTCYTIFKGSAAPQQEPEDKAAIQATKNEIYLFRKQLEMMDEPLPAPPPARDSPISMGIAISDAIDSPRTAHKKAVSRFNFNMVLFRPSPEFATLKKNITI